MHGKHPLRPHPSLVPIVRRPATGPPGAAAADPLRMVAEAAARNTASDFEHEHSAPELQAAVAAAVRNGAPIRDVAAAAHMTALEVLDATDAVCTGGDSPGPLTPGTSSCLSAGTL